MKPIHTGKSASILYMWVSERISERNSARAHAHALLCTDISRIKASERAPRRLVIENSIAPSVHTIWFLVCVFLILKSFRCYCLCSFLAPFHFYFLFRFFVVFFYFFFHLVAMVTITTTTHSFSFHFVNSECVHLLFVVVAVVFSLLFGKCVIYRSLSWCTHIHARKYTLFWKHTSPCEYLYFLSLISTLATSLLVLFFFSWA